MPVELGAVSGEMLTMHNLNGAQRAADGAANVAEQTRLQHVRMAALTDSVAAGKLLVDPLATQVLQARAAADQPQAVAPVQPAPK
jgi:hypothetical protein